MKNTGNPIIENQLIKICNEQEVLLEKLNRQREFLDNSCKELETSIACIKRILRHLPVERI